MNEYERCRRLWSVWQRSAPHEILSRLDNYHMMEAYHATKMEFPELPFNAVTQLWNSSKLSTYSGSILAVLAFHNFRVQAKLSDVCLEGDVLLSADLVSGIHHALSCGLFTPHQYVDLEERPGEFKQSDEVTGVFDVGTSPEEVEGLLEEMILEMDTISDKNDTLVAGAYLHARLLFLRPFNLVNTSTAIAVMNYWLRLEGHPPVVIPSAEIKQYRSYLETFDLHEDIEPLVVFFSEKISEFWGPQMRGKETSDRPRFTLRM